jgi:ribose 5-phosphate isomerase B
MKQIYLATDHAGFALKEELFAYLKNKGHDVIDCGATALNQNDDYPDFIKLAAKAVSEQPDTRCAIVLGGSGTGEAIVANRFPHVRCVVYNGGPREIITLSREHNDANVLSFGARFVNTDTAIAVVEQWLSTAFSHDQRHKRRIAKIEELH